ncbi:MAG: 30S ribosomal protein S1 [Candidatus Omnitrophica bacterium]|nr:30S ribosomal protein S1 [Candidatus Omnitrophota bacterium]
MKSQNDTLESLYGGSFKNFKDGQIVKGKVVNISSKEAMIDIGYKSEGMIPLIEFDSNELVIGAEVEVLIESLEADDGTIVLSKEKVRRMKGWDEICAAAEEGGQLLEGKVKAKIKGGYTLDVMGVDAFLPESLSTFRGKPQREIINNVFKFQVIKMNNQRRSLIVSRKDALAKERDSVKKQLWQELKIGDIRQGQVKAITDFGAFVDLGGVDGLLHITDMSWSRISHPSEIVAIGDKIEVMILNLDKDNSRVSLGLKQRTPDPWENVEERFPPETKVKGKIVNILNYGLFVELEKGIEGLVHISEISWSKRTADLKDTFAIGDMIEAKVLNVEPQTKRISLSIKQLEPNPWETASDKYTRDMKVTGAVRGFSEYGAFVELSDNLEGMIHVSDMSWTKKISHPQEVLRKGQRVEVIVLSVDAQNQKISLGLKQLTENPWPKIAQEYELDKIVEAEVSSLTNFGVFVKLSDELEGLIYTGEIEPSVKETLKPGDKIKAKIIKVDVDAAKIGLSAKLE